MKNPLKDAYHSALKFFEKFNQMRLRVALRFHRTVIKAKRAGRDGNSVGRRKLLMERTVAEARGQHMAMNRWLRSVQTGYFAKRVRVEGRPGVHGPKGHHRFIAPQTDYEHSI